MAGFVVLAFLLFWDLETGWSGNWGAVSVGVRAAYSALAVTAVGFTAWQWEISRTGVNRVLV